MFATQPFSLDIKGLIITVLIGYVVYKLTKLYLRVWSLPPGPIPLPIVGNILAFRGTKVHWTVVLGQFRQRYGPVFTLWLGMEPTIFISDIDIARESFRKNELAGRPYDFFAENLSNDKHSDIVFTDYGHQWEAMRRVAHSAVQKYSTSERLVYLVTDCVDYTFDTILAKEGFDKPFLISDYIYGLFLNIMAASAFGKRYDFEDEEYKRIKYIQRDFFLELNPKIVLWQFLPITKLIYGSVIQTFKDKFDKHLDVFKSKFRSHYEDYSESSNRDFCDTLITAKNEALRDGKESAPYLKDTNLAMACYDLFLAGTDTSSSTFEWIVLYLLHYKEVQKRLRDEIENAIGDRMPTHEDRDHCHYVMAFISEMIRIRNVVPQGLTHKAVVTTKLDQFTVDKGTNVMVVQGHALTDPRHWNDPQQFRPERFLENGQYAKSRSKAFIPFGVGRRVCLGEKLATTDLFLVLVRFLQRTAEYELVLEDWSDSMLEPDPNIVIQVVPKPYKIAIKSKVKHS